MRILGWYSLIITILALMITIASDKSSSTPTNGKLKLMTLIFDLPMIFYIAKTLGLF